MLDGTAPHSEDTRLPGARDEIVNLGAFWDSEARAASVDQIQGLDRKKSAAYQKAYRFLSACFEVDAVDRSLLAGCVRQEKLRRAVARLCEHIPNGTGFGVETRIVDSIGMKGSVRFDSLEREARTLYWIDDEYGGASFFLAALADEAIKKQSAIRVARDPVTPDRLFAVLFAQSGVCFVSGNKRTLPQPDGSIRVNMKRFLDAEALSDIKSELRANRRLRAALLDSAVCALREAGECHFALEQIYVSCMDFEAQNRFLTSFCESILSRIL